MPRRSLYLVKRGPKPEYYKAPYHPVIICDHKRIAEEECDWSGRGSTMWMKPNGLIRPDNSWLILRWNGLIIDYGHTVRCFHLPDGTLTGFEHDRTRWPYTLIKGVDEIHTGLIDLIDERRKAIGNPIRQQFEETGTIRMKWSEVKRV